MRAPDPRPWSIPGNAAEEKTLIVLTICSTKGGVGKTTLTANLAEQGCGASHTLLNSAAYAVQSLESTIPVALGAGMSQVQIDRIRKLHKAFVSAWSALQVPDARIRPVAVPDAAGSTRRRGDRSRSAAP